MMKWISLQGGYPVKLMGEWDMARAKTQIR